MKQILLLLCALANLSILAQNTQTFNLQWKINPHDTLYYRTAIRDIDTSFTGIDFVGLSEMFGEHKAFDQERCTNIFRQINNAYEILDLVTLLTTEKNGIVDIQVQTLPEETESDSVFLIAKKIMQVMQSKPMGIVLRGSIDSTGGIHSFWLETQQKNLIALLYELPKKTVKIGDQWPLEIDLISNDQDFDCDSSFKINQVTLLDVKESKEGRTAVLKYHIIEYVSGDYYSRSFFGNEIAKEATVMKFVYNGFATFSIDKGRWLTYDGILSLEASGAISTEKVTKLTLSPISTE